VRLAPGEVATVRATLSFAGSNDMAPFLKPGPALQGDGKAQPPETTGVLAGVPLALVRFEREGALYAWTWARDGRFTLRVPVGCYDVSALAPDWHSTATKRFCVEPDADNRIDLGSATPGGRLDARLLERSTGTPLPFRMQIEGGRSGGPLQVPRVVLAGPDGVASLTLPEGTYTLSAGYGVPFLAPAVRRELSVVSGEPHSIVMEQESNKWPAEAGLYCADLHHHSNLVDGRTDPADVAAAQVAAGLDFLFLSDHDTTDNHVAMELEARKFSRPFIPSVEVSAPWGHFNVFPWPSGKAWSLNRADRSPGDIFDEARSNGAMVQVNHPFASSSAYFLSREKGSIIGDYDESFTFVEMNGHDLFDKTDDKTLSQRSESSESQRSESSAS